MISYHPQVNSIIVERNNRQLDDSLQALLLIQGHEKRDRLVSKLMVACRGAPHLAIKVTANLLLLC